MKTPLKACYLKHIKKGDIMISSKSVEEITTLLERYPEKSSVKGI
jgi:hypothetical protein